MTGRDRLPVDLADGMWAVVTRSWVAGFVVEDGAVERLLCAPILWRRLGYWQRMAQPVQLPPLAAAPD